MRTLVLIVTGLLACSRVQAATYTLQDVVQPSATAVPTVPALSLSISDAAVAQGNFSFSTSDLQTIRAGTYSGTQLISFSDGVDVVTPQAAGDLSNLDLALWFNDDGTVSRAKIWSSAPQATFDLTGSETVVSGAFYPHEGTVCDPARTGLDCRILSAALVNAAAVPEPASALLGALALGLFGATRRQLSVAHGRRK